MKKIILYCIMLVNISVHAQKPVSLEKVKRNINTKKLNELRLQNQKDYEIQRKETEKIAKEKKIPLTIKDKDGKIAVLVRFDKNGVPIYLTTNDVKNQVAAGIIKTNLLNVAPYNLNGNGIRVGVWDGGGVLTTHEQFTGGRITLGETIINNDHATHVTGTIAGDGIGTGVNASSAKGMAPQSTIISYDFYGNIINEMTNEILTNTLLMSNNSYGFSAGWYFSNGVWNWFGNPASTESWLFGAYTNDSKLIDDVVNADPYYLSVFAAGNSRNNNKPNSVTSYLLNGTPSTTPRDNNGGLDGYESMPGGYNVAKNVLTVGSISDTKVNSTFSCWGPTDDGRIKPDVVSNGESVFSSIATGNQNYASKQGTSMASPTVTGSVALLQELFEKENQDYLEAATLKALLIHTAEDLGNAGPDYSNGWGLIDSKKAADIILDDKRNGSNFHIRDGNLSSSNNTYTFDFYNDGNTPIKGSLAWSDPGNTNINNGILNPTNRNLVNDLNIKIEKIGGPTFLPFVLNPAIPASVATTGVNNRDNVEQVFIATPTAGNYKVTITYLGTLTNNSQDFSLILTGNNRSSLLVRDNPADIGVEPNPYTITWVSPDIWIRKTNDGSIVGEDAEYRSNGNPNYVYVRIKNLSNHAFHQNVNSTVKVYFNKASTGGDWPVDWVGNSLNGDFIGQATIPNIPANGDAIVSIPWIVPNPANYTVEQNHFCLLARIESPEDPMNSPEGTNTWLNVNTNNNIAQKNIAIYDLDPTNLLGLDKPLWLTLKTGNAIKSEKTKVKINIDPALFDNGTVKLIANEKIKASLVKSKLTGIKAIASPKTTIIRGVSNAAFLTLDSKTGVIENLDLKENDDNLIALTFEPKIKNLTKDKSYYIDIVHYGTDKKTGKEVIIGGERIQINYLETNKKKN